MFIVTIVMTYWQLKWCKSCVNLVCCIFWTISSFPTPGFPWCTMPLCCQKFFSSWPLCSLSDIKIPNHCNSFAPQRSCERNTVQMFWKALNSSDVFCTVVLKDILGYNAEFFGIEVSFVSRCVESSFSQSSIWFQFVHLTLDF